MKLVEILARDLDKWPNGALALVQDMDSFVGSVECGYDPVFNNGSWNNAADYYCERHKLAADHTTAIITREMWEAERAKLKKPKANAEGWIRHRGGKCPVEAGVPVDVRHRDGEIVFGVPACVHVRGKPNAFVWRHNNDEGDIMAYRLHKPEQPDIYAGDAVAGEPVTVEFVDQVIGQLEGPLYWRDRIHEIDAARKEEEARHCAAMEAFDKERADLVAKLAAEGLALVDRVESEPAEDMSDWRNWRVGDLLEFVENDFGETNNKKGAILPILDIERYEYDGVLPVRVDRGWPYLDKIKWHSRP